LFIVRIHCGEGGIPRQWSGQASHPSSWQITISIQKSTTCLFIVRTHCGEGGIPRQWSGQASHPSSWQITISIQKSTTCLFIVRTHCGEGGIRTLGTLLRAHSLSRRAHSTTLAPLQTSAKIGLIQAYFN
jgi:hypothetical protein